MKKSKPNNLPLTELLHLSSDVLADEVITRLGARELCALGSCSSMFRALTVRIMVHSGPQTSLFHVRRYGWMVHACGRVSSVSVKSARS